MVQKKFKRLPIPEKTKERLVKYKPPCYTWEKFVELLLDGYAQRIEYVPVRFSLRAEK
jgi:hypothetical protein